MADELTWMADLRRQQLIGLLGDRPHRDRPTRVLERRIQTYDRYLEETLLLDLNGIEAVPATLLIPRNVARPRVVLYNHSHGGRYKVGRMELTESPSYMQAKSWGQELVDAGCAVLAIDHWAFGQRSTRDELTIFKHMLWHGQLLWGMMLYDSQRALDFLQTRSDLDTAHIITLGMSMGGTHAIWLSALEERISLCIDLCGSADFQTLVDRNALHHHNVYYYVPGLLKEWTMADVQGLIAPRKRLCLVGSNDPLTAGSEKVYLGVREIYQRWNAVDRIAYHALECGHEETAEMRALVMEGIRAEVYGGV